MVAVIVLLGAASGFLYFQTSSTISSLNQTVTSQSVSLAQKNSLIEGLNSTIASDLSRISTLNSQMAADNATIATLRGQIADDLASIRSLNATVASDKMQISSLNSTVTSDSTQINSLRSQVSSDESQISNLTGQVSTLKAQVSSLQSQMSSLQSQVSSLKAITELGNTTTEQSSHTFTLSSSSIQNITSFTVQYAGYVVVDVTAASDPKETSVHSINVYSSSIPGGGQCIPGCNTFYVLSSVPFEAVFPVLPGTVTIDLYNSATSSSQTATVSVTYYF